jgi:fused signal recognition particle receptor
VTSLVVAAIVAAIVIGGYLWWRSRGSEASAPVGPPVATRRLGTHLGSLFRRSFDDGFWDATEEQLIAADTGMTVASRVVAAARAANPSSTEAAADALRAALVDLFGDHDRSLDTSGSPGIVMVVGVNGSGKTTTIAKLAAEQQNLGRRVVAAAADTYRAAAAEQVAAWGERLGFDVVRGADGSDPAAVAFDALAAARARDADVLVVDTAGRLHSNRNLMDELGKVARVLEREAGSLDEVLLVIDGSAGQNALAQARAFAETVAVTGVAVTKLDGTARGGVVLAIEQELGIPVKLIGLGEGPEDMLHFSPEAFVDELLSEE